MLVTLLNFATDIIWKAPPIALALGIAVIYLSGDVPMSAVLKQHGVVGVPLGIWLWFTLTRILASLGQVCLWTQGNLGIVNGLIAGLAILLSGLASVLILHQPMTISNWCGLAAIVMGVLLLSR